MSMSVESQTQSIGLDLSNLDTTANPGNDFYQYACGGWISKNPIPDDYSRFGTFDLLAKNNRKQLRDLILELASVPQPAGSVAQKISVLYNQVMDSTLQNKQGFTPLSSDLQRIAKVTKKCQIPSLLSYLQSVGVDVYFSLIVGADPMNSNNNLLQTYQSGLGLPDRDYYFDQDSSMQKIRKAYRAHIVKMFELSGFSHSEANKAMKAVWTIESRIASKHYSKEQQRDPYANYHKMSISALQSDYSGFDWGSYLKGFSLDVKEISVSQPEPIHEVIFLIDSVSLKNQKYYFDWCLINSAASCLDDKFYAQNFDFYGKTLSGTPKPKMRWERAVNMVNGSLGEAVGQMYVQKYFPVSYKNRMLTLVNNLQNAFSSRLRASSWMGDSTKALALDKLAAFHVKIGYPDKWRDYSKLEVSGSSLWQNCKNVAAFNNQFEFSQANLPVDKDRWYMTPQTVNAYYNPTTNEVCFPAGILQYPFFDMNADDAFNYGAIGVVIGHEMTHGFDDEGRQFDKNGNLADWWTKSDGENFKTRSKVLADHFSSIEVAPGVHANGIFTLGENMADHGGLQISFNAFTNATKNSPLKTIDGLTPAQRFFIAYAGVWAGVIRPEEILRRTKTDPHALGRYRVNGALPEVGAWYDAFGISPSDALYVSPADRVSIW